MHTVPFFEQFIKNPVSVAAVAPTSRRMASVLADSAGVQDAGLVVEFGAGTGAITRVIAEKLPAGCRFVSIEINQEFISHLRENEPALPVIEGSATDARSIIERETGERQCDAIVSGLPLAAFNEELQDAILEETYQALRPGGRFVNISYIHSPFLPRGKTLKTKLLEKFPQVWRSKITWPNVPPAFGYICVRPEENGQERAS